MRNRPTPATVLAGAALFFALGGSAFAVAEAVKPQPRCTTGAVRGIATVVGDPAKGIGNIPDQFASAKGLFARQFNCGAGAIQVRRIGEGQFEVRFPGNPANSGMVSSPFGHATTTWANGVFRVTVYRPGQQDPPIDVPFTLIAF